MKKAFIGLLGSLDRGVYARPRRGLVACGQVWRFCIRWGWLVERQALWSVASGGGGSWSGKGAFGGCASGGGGSWSEGANGGSASGGGGSWSGTAPMAAPRRVEAARGVASIGAGGSARAKVASGGEGSWVAKVPTEAPEPDTGTSTYGNTYHASNNYATTTYSSSGTYYGGSYSTYHPPTTVNYYGSSCYNCGGWSTAGAAAAGVAVGAVVGATVASANSNAAAANAYNSGYAAGSANTAYAMGGDLSDDTSRIHPTIRQRHNLLLLQQHQHVVRAIIRRKRRLLSRGAYPGLIRISACERDFLSGVGLSGMKRFLVRRKSMNSTSVKTMLLLFAIIAAGCAGAKVTGQSRSGINCQRATRRGRHLPVCCQILLKSR